MISENLKIRIAKIADAPRLVEIYAPYVKNTTITFENEVPSVEEFSGRIKKTLEKYPYIVAELDGKVLGYAYAGPFKGRASYNWSVELSVYVEKNSHGLGIGRRLYTELEDLLKKMGICNLYACIATTVDGKSDEYLDDTSPKFHAKMGFSLVAEFKNCANKFGKWYSMIWMEKIIAEKYEFNQRNVEWFGQVGA